MICKYGDYQDLSKLTDQHTLIDGNPITYYVYGLMGEVGELILECEKTAQIGHQYIELELGDILWYISQIASNFNWDLDILDVTRSTYISMDNSLLNLTYLCTQLCQVIKKSYRQYQYLTEYAENEIKNLLIACLNEWATLIYHYGLTYESVMDANLDKLFERFIITHGIDEEIRMEQEINREFGIKNE